MAYHWYNQYSPPSFSLSLSSPSTNKAALVLERDFLSSVEEHNYGMSGLDVTLSLRPPLGDCKKCSACGETKTPLWRNGPDGPKTLCNACGIRYRKEAMKINTNLSLAPPDHVLHFSAQGKGAF